METILIWSILFIYIYYLNWTFGPDFTPDSKMLFIPKQVIWGGNKHFAATPCFHMNSINMVSFSSHSLLLFFCCVYKIIFHGSKQIQVIDSHLLLIFATFYLVNLSRKQICWYLLRTAFFQDVCLLLRDLDLLSLNIRWRWQEKGRCPYRSGSDCVISIPLKKILHVIRNNGQNMHPNIQPGDLRKLCTLRERAGNHGSRSLLLLMFGSRRACGKEERNTWEIMPLWKTNELVYLYD